MNQKKDFPLCQEAVLKMAILRIKLMKNSFYCQMVQQFWFIKLRFNLLCPIFMFSVGIPLMVGIRGNIWKSGNIRLITIERSIKWLISHHSATSVQDLLSPRVIVVNLGVTMKAQDLQGMKPLKVWDLKSTHKTIQISMAASLDFFNDGSRRTRARTQRNPNSRRNSNRMQILFFEISSPYINLNLNN